MNESIQQALPELESVIAGLNVGTKYQGPERRSGAGRRQSDLSTPQQLEVALALAAFYRLSIADKDLQPILQRLISAASCFVDGCELSIVIMGDNDALYVAAASSDASHLLTERQIEENQGPVVEAIRGNNGALAFSLRENPDRWPRFSPLCVAVGFPAVHVVLLQADAALLGALVLYDPKGRAFNEIRGDLLTVLAHGAAHAIRCGQSHRQITILADQLQTALSSRIVIEQAKGMVAARLAVDPEGAFGLLRRYARTNRSRLPEVCQQVVDGKLSGLQLREVETRPPGLRAS